MKNCNQIPFEVRRVNCPDCKRKLESIENGKKKCNKCLQYVIFEKGEPIKAIPKELVE